MRRGLLHRGLAALLLAGAVIAAPVRGWAEDPAQGPPAPGSPTPASPAPVSPTPGSTDPLRVCADPDNLPFSSSKSDPPGLYVEIARKFAESVGRPVQFDWSLSYFGAHNIRETLLKRHCDMVVGLPRGGFMGPFLIFSRPFMHIGYALMMPAGSHLDSFAAMAGKRIAVQYSTTPQGMLALHDDVKIVTFLDPEDAAKAVGNHEADAAFIWGPVAGWYNRTELHGQFEVEPIDGDGLQFPVAIGFNRTDTELRGQVDRFIDENADFIGKLEQKYGLPTAAPVRLSYVSRRGATLNGGSETPALETTGGGIAAGRGNVPAPARPVTRLAPNAR